MTSIQEEKDYDEKMEIMQEKADELNAQLSELWDVTTFDNYELYAKFETASRSEVVMFKNTLKLAFKNFADTQRVKLFGADLYDRVNFDHLEFDKI